MGLATEDSAEAESARLQGEIIRTAEDSHFAAIAAPLLLSIVFIGGVGSGRVLKDFSGWFSVEGGLG